VKCKSLLWLAVFPALVLTLPVQAHDPAEHMKVEERPDCTAMRGMDHSKMDMDDPVVQAMMQKCMDEMHQDEAKPDASEADQMQHKKKGHKESSEKHEH
jgi:hypothetical protein